MIVKIKVFLFSSFFLINMFISNAQSLTFSDFERYLNIKNKVEIEKDIISKGFKYFDFSNGMKNFTKETNDSREGFSISVMNNLLGMCYYSPSYYIFFKELILLPENKFLYKYTTSKGSKYYENDWVRIGLDDENYIVSFFVSIEN